MRRFDGVNKLEFSSFWSLFKSGIDSNNFEPVQKLNYLLSLLSGEALMAISSLEITNESYVTAKEILVKRYGGKHRIVDLNMTALQDIPKPVYTASSLQFFIDSINKHMSTLAEYGTPEEECASMLLCNLNKKVPESVTTRLIEKGPNWTLKQLFASIEIEINILERKPTVVPYHNYPAEDVVTFMANNRPAHQKSNPPFRQQPNKYQNFNRLTKTSTDHLLLTRSLTSHLMHIKISTNHHLEMLQITMNVAVGVMETI